MKSEVEMYDKEISAQKLFFGIVLFSTLVALPVFLFVAFIKNYQPSTVLIGYASLGIFKYAGRIFNEEAIMFYLTCGYAVLISVSFFMNSVL